MRRHWRCLPLLPLLLAGGCQSDSPMGDLLQGRQIDYTSPQHQSRQDLQYPPDLLSSARGVEGTVSLSEYTVAAIPKIGDAPVAVDAPASDVAYRRAGNLRWVEVSLPPQEAWQAVRNFWQQHLGFDLAKENPELGTMETGWLDIRERIATPGVLGEYVDDFLNRVNDSGERDKFNTRLERNAQGGSDVFIAHRHIVASFNDDGLFGGFATQQSEAQVEVEMLRRLMLYLAGRALQGDNSDIQQQVAAQEAAGADYQLEEGEITIGKPYRESWQLVQVALSRGGFNIEDRNYDEGAIYIRHSGGPGSDRIFGKAESGFFSGWFGDDEPLLRSIKLVLHRSGQERTRLTSQAVDEDPPLTPAQSAIVLQLVHQYLP